MSDMKTDAGQTEIHTSEEVVPETRSFQVLTTFENLKKIYISRYGSNSRITHLSRR
jgi:hypothetical protein